MSIAILAVVSAVLALGCVIPILVHAFRRSVGTAAIVLLVPAYLPVYAFNQFEHRRKGLIVAGMLTGIVLAAVFGGLALQLVVPPLPAQTPPIG